MSEPVQNTPDPPRKGCREQLKLSIGGFGLEGSLTLVVGIILGAGFIIGLLYYDKLPNSLTDPIISQAVKETLEAQPTSTPATALVMKFLDRDTDVQYWPELGQYELPAGAKITIEILSARDEQQFRWWLFPEGYGLIDNLNDEGSRVVFTVPISPTKDTIGIVGVCEPHPTDFHRCRGGTEHNELFVVTQAKDQNP